MTTTNDNSSTVIFDGKDAVTAYAFLAIRRALKFRVDHPGHSVMRNQEIHAARNHGWTTAKTAKKALEDMNRIAVDCGMNAI